MNGLWLKLRGSETLSFSVMGFPKVRGTFLGGAHNKDYSILGSILGYPNLGNYLISSSKTARHDPWIYWCFGFGM